MAHEAAVKALRERAHELRTNAPIADREFRDRRAAAYDECADYLASLPETEEQRAERELAENLRSLDIVQNALLANVAMSQAAARHVAAAILDALAKAREDGK